MVNKSSLMAKVLRVLILHFLLFPYSIGLPIIDMLLTQNPHEPDWFGPLTRFRLLTRAHY